MTYEIRYLVSKNRNLFTKIRLLVRFMRDRPAEIRYLVRKSRNLFTKIRFLVRFERDRPAVICNIKYCFWLGLGVAAQLKYVI